MQNRSNRLVRRRLVGAWVSTVISISLVLLLVGVASILLLNARSVSDYFKENLQVSVLMKQDVTDEQALVYQSTLAGIPGVKATTFISREQGKRGLVFQRLLVGHVLLHQDRDLQVLLEIVGHAAGVEQQNRRDAHEKQHQADADHRGHPGSEEPAADKSVAAILHNTPNFAQS